jgi:hypothetical protein
MTLSDNRVPSIQSSRVLAFAASGQTPTPVGRHPAAPCRYRRVRTFAQLLQASLDRALSPYRTSRRPLRGCLGAEARAERHPSRIKTHTAFLLSRVETSQSEITIALRIDHHSHICVELTSLGGDICKGSSLAPSIPHCWTSVKSTAFLTRPRVPPLKDEVDGDNGCYASISIGALAAFGPTLRNSASTGKGKVGSLA